MNWKYIGTITISLAVTAILAACASIAPVQPGAPEAPAKSPAAELGEAWEGAEVRIERSRTAHERGSDIAQAEFHCVWTDGQSAGTAHPQKFIDVETGEEVSMNFLWDHGGTIQAGVYDVMVDLDYPAPGEGWLRHVPLEGRRPIDVRVDLNGAKIELPLGEVPHVVVYPEGTYEDYESRNMLDEIPEDVEITRYDECNLDCVAPSGSVDLRVAYADGRVEWQQDYDLPANSKVTEL